MMEEKKIDNLELYNSHREVPETAKKKITGGRMNGMTDISPMWRIKSLTEMFGACGVGWKYTIEKLWTEECNEERPAFAMIALQYLYNGEWSAPVIGIGGSMMISKEKAGLRVSDEAYKMAITDAISVCCKQLGIGADVYWSGDVTKYSQPQEKPVQSKLAQLKQACAKYAVDEKKVAALCDAKNLEDLTDVQLDVLASRWSEIKNDTTYRKNP